MNGSTFDDFSADINEYFDTFRGQKLFKTDAADLFDTYLDSFKDKEERQHHNCNTCRSFIQRYGGLVVIAEDGTTTPVMWPKRTVKDYDRATKALRAAVSKAKVVCEFLSSERDLGREEFGGWTHFSVRNPKVFRDPLKSAGQAMAAKRQEFATINKVLVDYSDALLDKADELLASGQFYRADRAKTHLQWVRDLKAQTARRRGKKKAALVWRAVANAPAGFTSVRAGALGSLLSDIKAGYNFAAIKRRWAAVMNPETYQRTQNAPGAQQVRQAEILFEELGLAPALGRRFATVSDIPKSVVLWEPRPVKTIGRAKTPGSRGLFGHLTATGSDAAASDVTASATKMTWAKFQRTVLRGVDKLEVLVPRDDRRFMALVTADDEDAPPLLQWDDEDDRNPVSWFYAGGIDGEMRRRVQQAGGQFDNVDIRCTLMWNDRNDLDIHAVFSPDRPYAGSQHIYYSCKKAAGGWLDVDMNVRHDTDKPVENIRWGKGKATNGRYKFYVQNYSYAPGRQDSDYTVELEVGGQTYRYTGRSRGTSAMSNKTVFEFDYRAGAVTRWLAKPASPAAPSAAAPGLNAWGLESDTWATVKSVVPSPNLWKKRTTQHGKHTFFLLDGCAPTDSTKGLGFITETLRGDLREVRRTLESFTKDAEVYGVETADACGLGMVEDQPWNLTVRATSGTRVNLYKIDRFD
ncbi:MAG: hypothetical protein P1V36_01655 [Planctomycetota bacterium]|nr:hypothetical protein [Planctomycetota bacterium]